MDWTAVGLSLRLASCTTVVLAVVGLPLAWWLAQTRWRGRFLLEALVALPLVLPPTVLGFYLLLALGPASPLGQVFTALTGSTLPFSFGGLVIASVIGGMPFAVRPFAVAFAGIDQRLLEASWCLGVSRWGTFRRIVLPLSWHGILTGLILTFAHCIGEFGVVLMVGGNIPGVTRTLSISLYDQVQALDQAAANRTALVLLLFAFGTLATTYALQRRAWIV